MKTVWRKSLYPLLRQIRQTSLLTDFEVRKFIRQKSAYVGVIVILMLTVLVAVGYYMRRFHKPGEKTYMGRLLEEIMNGPAFSMTALFPAIYFLLPMIIGVFVASAFAGEFQGGQIRTIVMRPVSRWAIFFSKFICMSLYGYLLLAILLLVTYVGGGLMFGFSGDLLVLGPAYFGRGSDIFILNHKEAVYRILLAYFFAGYALVSVTAMFMMFSSIFKKWALSTVVPLGIYYTSYILGLIPMLYDLKRFLPTRYMMIWRYAMGHEVMWDRMINDGIYLGIYTIAYLIIGGLVFSSSDV
jgi:ABC-2 type transport system permease protein